MFLLVKQKFRFEVSVFLGAPGMASIFNRASPLWGLSVANH